MNRVVHLSRASLFVAGAALFAASAPAAIWLHPNWGLIGELQTVAVYDTNLTARADNVEDVYGAVTPKLTLSRRGSATRLDIDAQVERTWFYDFSEYDSTDPQVNLLYEYPVRDDDEPKTHIDLHWGRDSTTNTDLGRRVRSEAMRGRWDQRVFDTGRTVGDIRVDGRSTDYREADLNTNDALALEARIGYGITETSRLGIGYGREWSRSEGAAGRGDTDGEEDRVTVRLLGQLLPKLSGSVEAGVAFVSYEGAVVRDDREWIASVNLRWEASAGTAATMRVSRFTDFSPEGATALRSESLLEFTREIGRGFSLRGGGGWSRVDTFFGDDTREANAVVLTAGLSYRLTDRFSAEISERWTDQDEDRDAFDYERHVVTAQMAFLF